MKTYTIRPLEWNPVRSRMYAREAVVPGGRYLIDRAVVREDWYIKFSPDIVDNPGINVDQTIVYGVEYMSDAKELAWQDWLRRITPALEECK